MTNERRFGALPLLILVSFSPTCTRAQSPAPSGIEQAGGGRAERVSSSACVVDASREAMALQVLLHSVRRQITSVAEAMPADKYSFQPTEGQFKGVRTFGQQVKHLAATNESWRRRRWARRHRPKLATRQAPKMCRRRAFRDHVSTSRLSARCGDLSPDFSCV